MATIQKIRSYGVVLIAVVGLALFAFIAEELVRAISSSRNAGRQVVGEVCGENVTYEEFNNLYAEYEAIVKMNNGGQNLTEQMAMQVRDQVWNNYVEMKSLEAEAGKLGLTVTDAEVKALINNGTSPILNNTPFVNQQTGKFDVNQLTQFLNNYKEVMNNPDMPEQQKEQFQQMKTYWDFIEKQVRQQALATKFNSLLAGCITTNPISTKAEIAANAQQTTIKMAAVELASMEDIKATDKDVKAKYKEYIKQHAEMVTKPNEARSIKYILVPVVASVADRADLEKEMNEYRDSLANGDRVANIVRESHSLVSYATLPVAKKALADDIAREIDSMSVGEIKGPYANMADNTMNVIKFIAKAQMPDSVQFAQIVVQGKDEKAQATADSILTALQQGAVVDSIAKTYNQSGAAQWLTSAQIDGGQYGEDDRNYIQTLLTTPANTCKKVQLSNATLVVKVVDRRNIIDKYDVAVIKRSIDFSTQTYTEAWNKFSSFLAANKTIEDIEANATKEGYMVQAQQMITSNAHQVANVSGSAEALRWVFDKAKKGDISELNAYGASNDQLLAVMLTDIHPKGTMRMEDLQEELTDLATADLQAAAIQKQMEGKSFDEVAKMKGAVQDTVANITLASPVFIQKLGAYEPALAGAVAAAKKGESVVGVRGNKAVYAFQVIDVQPTGANADEKQVAEQQVSMRARSVMNMASYVLRKNAEVEDNRYRFFQ